MLVALDDAAQSITLADAAGLNLLTIKVTEGTILLQSAVRVVLEAPLVQHGQGAAHPAVLGDQLLAYLAQLATVFNTHLHAGQLAAGVPVTPAPPLPPASPPAPSLLSTKVVVE